MSNKSRWTREEEINLVKNISGGVTFADLAIKHDRSENAIELRLKQIIYENVLSGKSIDSLSKTLNMNKDRVQQYYYAYKDFIEKKTGGSKINNNVHIPTVINIDKPKPIIPTRQVVATFEQHKEPVIEKHLDITEMTGGNKNKSKLDKINNKLKKLELENKIMKLIVENKDLSSKLNNLIKDKKVDANVKNVIKLVRDS